MFVLPPPPRYPSQPGYNGTSTGHVVPMIETNNILTTPTGPEYQFLVGEGLYVLKEDLHLATPPPHPSEAPITNPNPLATTPQPATAGTRLTLINLDVSPLPASFFRVISRSDGVPGSIQDHPDESQSSTEVRESTSDGGRINSSDGPPFFNSNAPAFGEGNTLLASVATKDANKKRKPKNNMSKSNSSFISRVINHETLNKKLQDRPRDGAFAFANINRAFQWLDLSSPTKAEYLTKILFTKAHCLCHDVNRITKSASHIDVIMGFSTGEIIWWEPISQRYTRLNKNGVINKTPVSEIRWIPGSEHLFLAAHMDGSLIVYDKEKEDASFSAEEEQRRTSSSEDSSTTTATTNTSSSSSPNLNNNNNNGTASGSWSAPSGGHGGGTCNIQVHKSVHSKNQKSNPIAVWKLSNQRINAFAFSPDNRHLAVVSEDGSLRIIDYLTETLLDLFYSYYGGLTCVCWSPDGKYVLTGGQDDLISIWCPSEKALIARCPGHRSWVTSVAFDPWRCDDKSYRFGSVGEDCRICLWDFSVGMLHRPKLMAAAVSSSSGVGGTGGAGGAGAGAGAGAGPGGRQRGVSVSSGRSATENGGGGVEKTEERGGSEGGRKEDRGKGGVVPHPVEPRATVAMLPPVLSRTVDADPLCWLEFTEDAILTSCKSGHLRTWLRPREGVAAPTMEEEKKKSEA